MDCGTFRENHGILLDESVPDAELAELRRHLHKCAACAAHDTAVRRALLLFRNMPPIEPSSDFSVRLHERLRSIRAESGPRVGRGEHHDAPHDAHRHAHRHAHRYAYRGPGAGTFAGLAAGVIAAGYLIVAASNWAPAAGPLAIAPVVSVAPATDPAADEATVMAKAVANAVANTAASDAASGLADAGRESDTGALAPLAGLAAPPFIAPVPAGSPVWPATVLAARAPSRLATMQIKLTSLGR
jgi:hypothetical protein